jgi:hypothetical protein
MPAAPGAPVNVHPGCLLKCKSDEAIVRGYKVPRSSLQPSGMPPKSSNFGAAACRRHMGCLGRQMWAGKPRCGISVDYCCMRYVHSVKVWHHWGGATCGSCECRGKGPGRTRAAPTSRGACWVTQCQRRADLARPEAAGGRGFALSSCETATAQLGVHLKATCVLPSTPTSFAVRQRTDKIARRKRPISTLLRLRQPRHWIRMMRKRPGFSVVSSLTPRVRPKYVESHISAPVVPICTGGAAISERVGIATLREV